MQKGIKRLKWNKKKFITLSIVAILIVSVSIGIFAVRKSNAVKNSATTEKRTVQVTRGNIEISLSGSGTVTSSNTSDLMANVSGKVTKSYFKEGDKVKKGDLLYEIDDTDAKLNIQKIENSISQAQLSVNSNQKNYSNLTVRAPFDGKVTEIAAKTGDSANNNMTLFTITQTSKLKVSVPFSTTYIKDIKIGQKAEVQVQEVMDTVSGTVTGIDDNTYTASNGGIVRNVEVTVDNPGRLTDTMTAAVDISTANGVESGSQISPLAYADKQLVKASASGTFSTVNVKENQYVKKGDVLITIENDDLQITSQTNDLKVQDLDNQLAAAQKQLEDYKVYSPIDGTVTEVSAVIGDSIKPGDTLINIRDFDQMQFTISIDELDIAKVKMGQKASITIDALEETTVRPLSGEVIYKAMEGASNNGVATYDVTIKINETENLLAGMNANAKIILNDAQDILMVPLEAVTKMGDRSFVRVIGTGDSTAQGQFGNRTNGWSGGNTGNTTGGAIGGNGYNRSGNTTGGAIEGNGNNRSGRNNAAAGSNGNSQGNTNSRQSSSSNSANRQMSAAMAANQAYYANTVLKEVELGINNDEYVEIKSGLSAGDAVVLPPLVANSSGSSSNTQGQGGFSLGGLGGGMSTRMTGGFPAGGAQQFNRNTGGSGTNSGSNRQSNSQSQRN